MEKLEEILSIVSSCQRKLQNTLHQGAKSKRDKSSKFKDQDDMVEDTPASSKWKTLDVDQEERLTLPFLEKIFRYFIENFFKEWIKFNLDTLAFHLVFPLVRFVWIFLIYKE